MPSFRTVFALAATAFAALSSAAPVAQGVNQAAQAVGVNNVANNVAQNVNVHDIEASVIDADHGKRADAPAAPTDLETLLANLGLGGEDKREEAKSLPVILLDVKAKLEVVTGTLKALVDGKTDIDVEKVKPIIESVRVILCGAVASVKLIIGHPIEFILSLDGKVLAAIDVCHILIAVLALVYAILACVLHVVAAASVHIVTPLIAGVATVLVELLVCIFVDLKVGIFAAIGPLLTPEILKLWAGINLDIVVAVLKKGTN
ncbi:hypothetical protein DXG01_007804 [Tephrocybe rancida]|nr:hypothetical protein DXG01_007804 [Tephrocybe rancida]